MLYGAGLPFKYWPFALKHSIMLHNALPHGSRGVPNERAGGKRSNLRDLRTFGCRVVVRPPGPRPSKLENHANVGCFLGYTATMTQAYYLEERILKVKTSSHARFDEGMTDMPNPPPNARQLRAALGHPLPPETMHAKMPSEHELVGMSSPFTELVTIDMKIRCNDPSLGMIVGACAARSRAFIVDIKADSSASKIRDWRRKYRGAYLVKVDKQPVFTKTDVERLLNTARDAARHNPDPHVEIILAPDTPATSSPPATGLPQLQMDQFRTAISVLYELGEGRKLRKEEIPDDGELSDAICTVVDATMKPGSKWTRCQLRCLGCWDEWYGAEKKQLDEIYSANMFGVPEKRPPNSVVL
jgi:hypothetical protein